MWAYYLGESLCIWYDIFEWTFFPLYFHYSLVPKLFICRSFVCTSFSLIFISFLAFLVQSSPVFAFQFCSGLEQANISSISILHQSSIYVEELCLCQKKFHIDSLLCQSFLGIFAFDFPLLLRVCPFLFCNGK